MNPRRRRAHHWLLLTLLTATALLVVPGCALAPPAPAAGQRQPSPVEPAPHFAGTSRSGGREQLATPLHLVGLGDSVMSGTACDCEGITAGLARELTTRDGRTVAEDNLGRSGDTAADLLDQLDQDDVRATLKSADYVVVVTGANDLATLLDEDDVESCDSDCSQPVIAAMQSRLAQALQTINHLTSGHATILVDGYWNVFQDGDQATSQYGIERVLWSRDLTRQANAAIAAAAQHAGARYVDLAAAFTAAVGDDPTSLLADDGDHPNAAGVQLIVRANLAVVDHTAPDHSDRHGAR